MRAVTTFVLMSVIAGCGAETDQPKDPSAPLPPTTGPFATARIWVDDDPWLPKVEVARGCGFWLDTRVQCLVVENKSQADIFLRANYEACSPSPDGGKVLASAYSDGSIDLYVRCMPTDGDGPDDATLHTLVAHEVGHMLGIWGHVPAPCDGSEKVSAGGVRVCGKAVMNPVINDLKALTSLDVFAYGERDQDDTVIKGTVSTHREALGSDRPRCVYGTGGDQ